MIEIDGVVKRYGELVALGGVSLKINAEVLGLIGANGAGKSTLFKLILGMIEPDAGRILVCGHDVKAKPISSAPVNRLFAGKSCTLREG